MLALFYLIMTVLRAVHSSIGTYRGSRKIWWGIFNLIVWHSSHATIKLISIKIYYPDTSNVSIHLLNYCCFVKLKSVIFKMQFEGYFIKFNSHHHLQPYGMRQTSCVHAMTTVLPRVFNENSLTIYYKHILYLCIVTSD